MRETQNAAGGKGMRETKHTRTHLALMGIFQLVIIALISA